MAAPVVGVYRVELRPGALSGALGARFTFGHFPPVFNVVLDYQFFTHYITFHTCGRYGPRS